MQSYAKLSCPLTVPGMGSTGPSSTCPWCRAGHSAIGMSCSLEIQNFPPGLLSGQLVAAVLTRDLDVKNLVPPNPRLHKPSYQ